MGDQETIVLSEPIDVPEPISAPSVVHFPVTGLYDAVIVDPSLRTRLTLPSAVGRASEDDVVVSSAGEPIGFCIDVIVS